MLLVWLKYLNFKYDRLNTKIKIKTIIDKFVDRPTNTNLEKLNEVASMYTDAWIQHWANEDADVFEKLSPSQDLAAHFTHDFMEATESIEDFLETKAIIGIKSNS